MGDYIEHFVFGNRVYNCKLIFLVMCFLQKMVNGGTVNDWICINFSRNVPDNAARNFCRELADMCQTSGMVGLYHLHSASRHLFFSIFMCIILLY
jgi:hypothetical protein